MNYPEQALRIFDPDSETAFCLVGAPSKETAETVPVRHTDLSEVESSRWILVECR